MRILKFILFTLILSCGSVQKIIDLPHSREGQAVPRPYAEALTKIEQGEYSEARTELQNFLRDHPVTSYTEAAEFNIGYTFEFERNYSAAAEKYREVASATAKSAPRLQTYALYRLSYCLEALGDNSQVIAVLTDVNNRKNLLPSEIATAELPARLAAVYSRVGNFELSQKYYAEAEGSLESYRRSNNPNRPSWLAKTLYHMGRVNLGEASWENFEIIVRPLLKAQQFLLEAAELNDPIWSKRAAEDLGSTYQKLWELIQNPPASKSSDEIINQRAQQQRQWEMTFQLVDLLDDLNRHRLTDQKSPYVQDLFTETEKVRKEIKKLLARQKVGSDLTPAARKRILGQRTLQKLPKKIKTETQPFMSPPPAVTPADPNL